jgi:hypothetical protein
VSQFDLHSKDVSLSTYRVPHDQQADIFVAESIQLSDFRLSVAYSNVLIITIVIIITILETQVSNSTIVVVVAIEAKIGISTNFGIVKTLVVHIISTSFIIVKASSSLLFLLRVDQLRRPVSRGEEEKQDQCELHAVPLRREGRSVACPVVVEQEQEVINAEDGFLPDRNIEFEVPS